MNNQLKRLDLSRAGYQLGKNLGVKKRSLARFSRDRTSLTSRAGTMGPTNHKSSPFISHHLISGIGTSTVFWIAAEKAETLS